jgi:hypothetical protein
MWQMQNLGNDQVADLSVGALIVVSLLPSHVYLCDLQLLCCGVRVSQGQLCADAGRGRAQVS